MQMCKSAWNEIVSKLDIRGTFKRNAMTIKLVGSEDYLVSSKLKALSNPHPASLKKLEEVMIPPDGLKYKSKKVVDGTPPYEGLEIIGGELTDEEWNDMKNEKEENNLDENGIGNKRG